jgi:Tol biopolymer transport system component
VEQPAQATTPGKNGLIVFSADTGAGHQLYTIKPNGRGLRQLTNLNGDAVAADWSPDGRRITFKLGTETHPGVMMNADGSGLRDLTPWSGKGLVVRRRRPVPSSRMMKIPWPPGQSPQS